MLGMSFNVNLSEEQMDHIAALTADRVNYTISKQQLTSEWYDQQIKTLENRLAKCNRIVVDKELFIVRLKEIIEKQEAEIKELKTE